MKILGLILVVFYAALMLLALWKQNSQNASASGSSSPADGALPDSGASSGKRFSLLECLPSICIGAGCLLLLVYASLYTAQNRSLMPLLIIGMLCLSAGTLLNGIRQKKVHLLHHIVRLVLEAAMVAVCWLSMSGMTLL